MIIYKKNRGSNMEKRTIYYKCNMKVYEHIIAYLICSSIISVIAYLFYHLVVISIVIGFVAGIFLEKIYAQSTITKRQRMLRLQFRDFLECMSVATRAGNVEVKAIESALKDLRISYNPDTKIISTSYDI